jgi:hypothetical protein
MYPALAIGHWVHTSFTHSIYVTCEYEETDLRCSADVIKAIGYCAKILLLCARTREDKVIREKSCHEISLNFSIVERARSTKPRLAKGKYKFPRLS